LFVTEAGGRVARPDGRAYRPGDPGFGLLVAQNGDIWDAVQEGLALRDCPATAKARRVG